jgi:hypothetical protein
MASLESDGAVRQEIVVLELVIMQSRENRDSSDHGRIGFPAGAGF